jgi:hypothetical protein
MTGEINILKVDEDYFNIYKDDDEFVCSVTLKELNEGWEDYYEEPKKYWFINASGEINWICEEDEEEEDTKSCKEIGNYFKNKEEAEKAVEKLKAWKRLKDKGFRLSAAIGNTFFCVDTFMSGESYEAIKDDLKIVFGGEE